MWIGVLNLEFGVLSFRVHGFRLRVVLMSTEPPGKRTPGATIQSTRGSGV